MAERNERPRRLLLVMPSWLGDVCMATPAMRVLRDALPGALIGALARPGIDALLDGSTLIDQLHVGRAKGVMGHKHIARMLRHERYDTAILFTNSFSTALSTRMAFIPRRIGFDRDGRGLLLTDRLHAPKRTPPAKGFAPIPAVDYYMMLADHLIASASATPRLQLPLSPRDHEAAAAVLRSAGIEQTEGWIVFNPGANNPAKRWPELSFVELANRIAHSRREPVCILVNGSPAEKPIADAIVDGITSAGVARAVSLPQHGMTIPALKSIVARAAFLVTNDTGPRHVAAAYGIPTVALFGPTDHRWTTLPDSSVRERILLADPSLPETELANDHPERCAVDRITVDQVADAVGQIWPIAGSATQP